MKVGNINIKGEKVMFTFNSPIIHENIWKIYLKTKKELIKIYYGEIKDDEDIEGIIDYIDSTIYLDKNLDDISLKKELRKKLMHLYLWETGQQEHRFTEEEFCDLTSVAAPLICRTADDIFLRIKKYEKGEK